MNILLPRLPGPACEALVQNFFSHDPASWRGFDPTNLPDSVRFAATGGTRAGVQQLLGLRTALEGLAKAHGFGTTGNRGSFATFDAATAVWLAQSSLFSSGEALRDDVWSFVGAVVAPDIVYWRFGRAMERYAGGVRNTFQRLWMRGRALDRGETHPERWQLLTELTEDALVQITERPSIGSDRTLSVAIAEAWLRASRRYGKGRMEGIMRRAILRIRITNEIRALADLPVSLREAFLDRMFSEASKALEFVADCPTQPEAGQGSPSLSDAVNRIMAEGELRRWLSPGLTAALTALREGITVTSRSDRNALDQLLSRLRAANLLQEETRVVKVFLEEASRSSEAPARPRKRIWEILRAR